MNLLYKGYNRGHYVAWTSGSDPSTAYYIAGTSDYMASYYADLKPNTTYILRRFSEHRFRVALSSQDLKYALPNGTSNNEIKNCFTKVYINDDSMEPIVFTTGETDIHLVVYYTNESQFDAKVMLNEGSEPQEYEEPTIWLPTCWHLNEECIITKGMFPDSADKQFSRPYPMSLWYMIWETQKLKSRALPDELINDAGAFRDNPKLKKVTIPESVTYIGPYAFANTALTEVKISEKCEYSPTSFPEDCRVEFY